MTGLTRSIADAWLAYRNGRATAAVAHAKNAVRSDHRSGPAWYALACALERDGRLRAADQAFRQAAKAEHEAEVPPFRVSWQRFERAVGRACDRLPPRMRDCLSEVDLVLQDYADPLHCVDQDEPDLLGLFDGPMRSELGDGGFGGGLAAGPRPRIFLYRRAHEHSATSAREFDAEVERTLLHEFAHYLGFDESDMPGMDLD